MHCFSLTILNFLSRFRSVAAIVYIAYVLMDVKLIQTDVPEMLAIRPARIAGFVTSSEC